MLLKKILKYFLCLCAPIFLIACTTVEKNSVNGTAHKTANKIFLNKALSSDIDNIDVTYPPSILELNFKSYGDRLNAILYQANGLGPHPTVVLLHGYPGNEKNLDLAQSLRRIGYNVFFFHYRGAWGSDGDFSFSNVIEDVGSAVNFLRDSNSELRVDPNRIMLIGHSMGGFAALQGAANDAAITCVAGLASADVGAIADLAKKNSEFAQSFSESTDNLTMLKGWTGTQMLKSLQVHRDEFSLVDLAPGLSGKSVLLIAGNKDKVIAPEVFHFPVVSAYTEHASIDLTHTIISGDHSFSWSRMELSQTVLEWASACMQP